MKNVNNGRQKNKHMLSKKKPYKKPKLYARSLSVDFAIACEFCSGPTTCPAYQ